MDPSTTSTESTHLMIQMKKTLVTDNVVGLVSANDEGGLKVLMQKSRSWQSSYADLQRLCMAPITTIHQSVARSEAKDEEDASPPLSPHRARRASLSDGVALTRIASLDPEEPFNEATQDLNEGISHTKSE
ncbi:hypothetical protein BDZ97DRAFT_1915474 [Flammula alnicola]|nr:hypothetical protein BDZ97DRAFT_1915474 [Flammula alnicola]